MLRSLVGSEMCIRDSSLFGGCFPRTERVRGVASVGRSGLGEVLKLFSVRGDQSLYTRVSLNRSERIGSLRTEPHQAVVSWFCLLIAGSCMHDICVFWCWLKTWKLERPNRMLKRKLRATHRERRRVPRKTGGGACTDSGSGMVGVEQIGSDGKPEVFLLFRANRSSGKVFNV